MSRIHPAGGDRLSGVVELIRTPRQRLTLLLGLLWVAQPFTTGALLSDALETAQPSFRTPVSIALWVGWLVVLLAINVPRPVTLTITRVGLSGGLLYAAWGGIESDHTVLAVVGVVAAGAALTVGLLPAIGDRFADGVSYGDEQRFLLRPPGVVVLALIAPTTILVIAGSTAGPLLLLNQQWVRGAVALVIGGLVAWRGINALHALTGRFLVFVPNGLVLHDRSTLAEPVLLVSREIAALGPARADTAATDLTSQALGLALEIRLDTPITLPLVTGRQQAEEQTIAALLVAPSRPTAVLETAVARGLTIA